MNTYWLVHVCADWPRLPSDAVDRPVTPGTVSSESLKNSYMTFSGKKMTMMMQKSQMRRRRSEK